MSGNTAESGFTPRRLVIVGCRGRMGTLLSARWSAAGHTVAGLDLPLTDEAFAEALPGADAVFLCIPAGAMAEVLPHLVPHLDGRQILADITSVKMQPLGQMERAYAGPVVGTHPLFGPKPQPSDLRVCITPGAAATDTHIGLVEGLFKDMGCTTFRSTAEAHDSAAASIQGLNFISSLAYFATLAEHEELLPFITPSFRRRLEASRKLLTEDAPLFEWLFEANPMSQESIRQYRSFLNVAAGGDVNVHASDLVVEEAGEIEEKLEGGRGTFLKKGPPSPLQTSPFPLPRLLAIESLLSGRGRICCLSLSGVSLGKERIGL